MFPTKPILIINIGLSHFYFPHSWCLQHENLVHRLMIFYWTYGTQRLLELCISLFDITHLRAEFSLRVYVEKDAMFINFPELVRTITQHLSSVGKHPFTKLPVRYTIKRRVVLRARKRAGFIGIHESFPRLRRRALILKKTIGRSVC